MTEATECRIHAIFTAGDQRLWVLAWRTNFNFSYLRHDLSITSYQVITLCSTNLQKINIAAC